MCGTTPTPIPTTRNSFVVASHISGVGIVVEHMGTGRVSRIHLDREGAAALAEQLDLAILETPT